MKLVLLDTGPLVALLDRRDQYHGWATAQVSRLRPPLVTCEAVLAEACFLLRRLPDGSRAVLELLARGGLSIPFRLEREATAIAKLLLRYASVPMSLADACLVHMSEQHADSAVLTIDQDFRVYRRHGRQVIPTMMPN